METQFQWLTRVVDTHYQTNHGIDHDAHSGLPTVHEPLGDEGDCAHCASESQESDYRPTQLAECGLLAFRLIA